MRVWKRKEKKMKAWKLKDSIKRRKFEARESEKKFGAKKKKLFLVFVDLEDLVKAFVMQGQESGL